MPEKPQGFGDSVPKFVAEKKIGKFHFPLNQYTIWYDMKKVFYAEEEKNNG